jgi:ABC-type sulfate/molybdate transport systems ATPase subunit
VLRVDLAATAPLALTAQFQAAAGTVTALFGPSGAGKTTLLRMIGGFHPSRGTLMWEGLDLSPLPPWERPIGYVAQAAALFPHWTVRRQLTEAAGTPDAGEEWLRALDLDALADRLPRALSGGQQQRVALARALARRPAILLLDEPFAHLDYVARRDVGRWLRERVAERRWIAVMATHDFEEVERLADQVLLVHAGRVLEQGTPSAVFRAPRSPEAARLLGYRAVGGYLVHPARADWLNPTRHPVVVHGRVRAHEPGRYGTLLIVEDVAGTRWEAFFPGESAPAVGTAVTVGYDTPAVGVPSQAPSVDGDSTP